MPETACRSRTILIGTRPEVLPLDGALRSRSMTEETEPTNRHSRHALEAL
jgi:hypothetical protein